ncbi:MAG: VWA domain-containing protein [Actinobacteria bacterium]|nr:VWA domain-containing protein [Actinomycetota bacterium]
MNKELVFPFAAVVGQERVRLALLLNAVSHQVGGVLIRGRRGTAKSTLVRGLAHLLPEIDVVTDCPFSCDPQDIESLCGPCTGNLALEGTLPGSRDRMKLVTLPLNVTEEMVVGTLDIEKALRQGEKSFEPGILARANRSILYVDEVNLLEDHIVDILLDSAAMGVNVVEREGISFRHGARFILVGTMNPEEGDLRPQLEDRFGLCADVDPRVTAGERSEILRRNLQFSRNPLEFESRWHAAQEELRGKLLAARERYPEVDIHEGLLDLIAAIVDRAGADGHRADLSMLYAGRALAALEECDQVQAEHLARVAVLSLGHRLPRGPLGSKDTGQADVTALVGALLKEYTGGEKPPEKGSCDGKTGKGLQLETGPSPDPPDTSPEESFNEVTIPRAATALAGGRRGPAKVQDSRGRYCRSTPPNGHRLPLTASDIAIDATIRSSALRGGGEDGKPEVLPEDLKVKVRKRKCGASIVFVVDASASMGARKRLDASREAILSLLVEAYQKRDRVGLVVFKDDSAQLVLSPTSSTVLASRLLSELTPGGTTPLSHGLALGYRVLNREMSRTPQPSPFLVLISDGGGNVTIGSGNPMSEALHIAGDIRDRGIHSVVLDSAPTRRAVHGESRKPAARRIADAMGSSYFPLRNMNGEVIVSKLAQSTGVHLEKQPQASH